MQLMPSPEEPGSRSSVGRVIRHLLSFILSTAQYEPRNEETVPAGHFNLTSSSTNPLYDSYYRHLSVMGHGIPIWIPEPNENLTIEYRKRGASIGDVVFFTHDGALDFLFNACLPADHAINSGGVPEGFRPFTPKLIANYTRQYQQYGDNDYLASKSITEQMGEGLPSGILFTSSSLEGAILTMPEGAYAEDLTPMLGFHRYLSENLSSWYKYVNEDHEWGVAMGELHVITGVHKAKAWGIATFQFAEETTAVDVNLQFKSQDNHPYRALYSWDYSGVTDSPRTGPTTKQRQSLLRSLTEEEHGQAFENQCLFVRTINSAIRGPQVGDAQADGIVNKVDEYVHSDVLGSSRGDIGSRQHSSGFDLGNTQSLPGGFNTDYYATFRRNGPVPREHPSKAINKFLLSQTKCRIAIADDQDWISLLTEDDVVLPTDDELLERLKRSYRIVEDDGIISLEPVDSDTSTGIFQGLEHQETPAVHDKPPDATTSIDQNRLPYEFSKNMSISDRIEGQPSKFNIQHDDTPGAKYDHGDENDSYLDAGSMVELRSDEFPSYFSERNGRLFHATLTSPYPLPVDEPEHKRLDNLHDLLRQLIGEHYIGPVAETLAVKQGSERQKMALDVCTGTGKWVMDMAQDFPHVNFRGIDIVPIASRYPPPNVQFEIGDVNTALRWENGTFDLVHSRFVDMAVIDYQQFAQEVARVLRPGGLFISYEWSPYPAFDPSTPHDPAKYAPASSRFHAAINAALIGCGLRLLGSLVPAYLSEVGAFIDIHSSMHYVAIGEWPSSQHMRRIGRACKEAQKWYASSIRPLLVEGGWRDEDVDELMADYFTEIENVDGLVSILYAVHARRL